MLRLQNTTAARRARLGEGARGERRAANRHHVSMACEQCRQRKRGCGDQQVVHCEECNTPHATCKRCVVDRLHCSFPPPESDGRRTSSKQLVAELDEKLAQRDRRIRRLENLLAQRGGDPAEANSPPMLTLEIPETEPHSDMSEHSPSPASLTSAGSSSWYSPSSPSPESAAAYDNQQTFLDVPGHQRLRLKRSTSLSNIGSPTSPIMERGYPLSANSSPLPGTQLQLQQEFTQLNVDPSVPYGYHGRSLSDTVTADDSLAVLAQYHAMTVHNTTSTTSFGLDLQLGVPSLHVYPATPQPASPPQPQQGVSALLMDQYINYDGTLTYAEQVRHY